VEIVEIVVANAGVVEDPEVEDLEVEDREHNINCRN